MKVLVTGVAGFIGMHTAITLIQRGDTVVGIDNLNDYYDVSLKQDRLSHIETIAKQSLQDKAFDFVFMDVADTVAMNELFYNHSFDAVIHLAAQAGVRYSIDNPMAYIQSNMVGFANILEGVRHHSVQHLVYASSSSVYGANESMPFAVTDNVDHPVSLYAASKKSNELMAHAYSHLYAIPTTGLRFFTVYGPWGRPDMSPIKFAKAIAENKSIDVYNYGQHRRDFTYIDDIVNGIVSVLDQPAKADVDWSGDNPNPATSKAPYRIYNIGNHDSVALLDYIACIEKHLGMKAEMNLLPLQPGDVIATYADVEALINDVGYSPSTKLDDGIATFIGWFKSYYNVSSK